MSSREAFDVAWLTRLLERRTPHREAFEAMGFKFHAMEVRYNLHIDDMEFRVMFECVCGKVECLTQILQMDALERLPAEFMARRLDPARILIEDIGSTSPQHLRSDGYSEAEIAEIQRKGRDALARLQ